MSAAPEVSIVVVTFEDRENAIACLHSIRRHADVEHEVILVDDGSSDATASVVRERFPEVLVVERERNGGLVMARNDALAHVRGRQVLMLDSDTELRSGALSCLVAALDAQPRVGLVGPRLTASDGALQPSCRRYPPFSIPFLRRGPYARLNPSPAPHRWHMMLDFDHIDERPVAYVIGAAQMWRRDLLTRLGPYDRRLSSYGGEDIDWCLRVWEAGLEVHYVPGAEVMHHWQMKTRQDLYGASSLRALWDWYYLQWKHRRLRGSPRMAAANA